LLVALVQELALEPGLVLVQEQELALEPGLVLVQELALGQEPEQRKRQPER